MTEIDVDHTLSDLELIREAESRGYTHVQVSIDTEESSGPKVWGIKTARIFKLDDLEVRRGV